MIPKLASCVGCPMYGDGQGFVPDEILPDSSLLILAQNPGSNEEREGRPMVGKTGELLSNHFIPLAGLERGMNVSIGNLLKCRQVLPNGRHVDDLPKDEAVLAQAIDHCTKAHLHIPDHITHICTHGAPALNWIAQPTVDLIGKKLPMASWRGNAIRDHRFPGKSIYATEHLASVVRDPKLWFVSELDWRKMDAWLHGAWPLPIPPYIEFRVDNWEDAQAWFAMAHQAPYLVIDTEFMGDQGPHKPGYLTFVGLGYQDEQGQVHGLQINWTEVNSDTRAEFSALLRTLVQAVEVCFQNFSADMPVLKRNCGIEYTDYKKIQDTMLGHAIQFCELPHTLEFQGSLYGRYPKLKHLSEVDQALYNWGDVLLTIDMREGQKRGFRSDPQAQRVYETQSLALIPLLLRSMEKGIAVYKPRVLQAKDDYEQKVQQAVALAHTALGWPINLGSDEQVKYYLYTERGYPVQTDPETGNPTVSQDAIAALRDLLGPPVKQKVDQEELTIERAIERILLGGDPILEARTLYMEYQHVLDAYIYSLHKSVSNASTEAEKKRAREKCKGTEWTLDDIVDRVYPTFFIHAQKTGRWSTSDPPLAQLPKALRNIICPDPGYVFLHWDWSGIELQFLEAYSGSEILKAAHQDGIDLHTWTTCAMFGYAFPPDLKDPHKAVSCAEWRTRYQWGGKDDPRRVFAKSARYEMNYGGVGATAADKAIRMGLNKAEVKTALGRLLTADVKYFAWRTKLEETVKRTRLLRTFMGRPRRFLGVSKTSVKVPQKVVREALDYQMQGGVSDVFNTVALQIYHDLHLHFSWGMHDSQYWMVPRALVTSDLLQQLRSIVTQPFMIEGVEKRFPADFGIITHPSEAPLGLAF